MQKDETVEYLKPCPFCGSDDVKVVYRQIGTGFLISDEHHAEYDVLIAVDCICGANTGLYHPARREQAIHDWNRRVDTSASTAPERDSETY